MKQLGKTFNRANRLHKRRKRGKSKFLGGGTDIIRENFSPGIDRRERKKEEGEEEEGEGTANCWRKNRRESRLCMRRLLLPPKKGVRSPQFPIFESYIPPPSPPSPGGARKQP